MIKNIVFDFGQVLVHFDPMYMTGQYIKGEADVALASEVIFDRLYWDRLDAGTIEDAEVEAAIVSRLPARLHGAAVTAYRNWIYNIPEIDGMRELVKKLKREKGVRVFVLSNISRYFAAHAHEIAILKEAEKCIFSAVCGHIKPDPDMFAYLCEECGILPEETCFIDDNAKNIAGAGAFGIHTYLFDGDAKRLEEHLFRILP